MVRSGSADRVSLTFGNWIGVIATIVSTMAGQWFLLQGRIATLEAKQVAMQREMDGAEQRSAVARREVLDEIRLIRQELKAK